MKERFAIRIAVNTYILLFRGFNVGGKNILPMKALTSYLEGEGYENVNTYIQSGNVVLNSASNPSSDVSDGLERKFGFKPEVMTLTKTAFERAITFNPFKSLEGKTVHFYFCSKIPKIDDQKLKLYAAADEEHAIHESVFYLHAPSGIGRSKLVSNIEACLGVLATGRNLNTVSKLSEMARNAQQGA